MIYARSAQISYKDYIGELHIQGMIMDDSDIIEKLDNLAKDNKMHGLIIEIDSPGGAVVPSYRIHNAIREIAKTKPVSVVLKSMAASGGYLIATAADHIVAHPSTITGSIGAIFFSPDATELMNKIGIKPVIFKSGKLKAAPNPGEKITMEGEAMMNGVLFNIKKQFLNLVLARRNIQDPNFIKDIENSGIYTGEQAQKIGLIDELGNINEALKWINTKNNAEYSLREIHFKKENPGLFSKIFGMTSKNQSTTLEIAEKISDDLSLSLKGFYLLYKI